MIGPRAWREEHQAKGRFAMWPSYLLRKEDGIYASSCNKRYYGFPLLLTLRQWP